MKFGLVVGASDLIGIVKPHGRFLALEVKTARGRLTKEQTQFLLLVNRMGGVARLVRSTQEAACAVSEASQPATCTTE